MAQRAELAGGRLRVEKAVQGTVVHCEIPLGEKLATFAPTGRPMVYRVAGIDPK